MDITTFNMRSLQKMRLYKLVAQLKNIRWVFVGLVEMKRWRECCKIFELRNVYIHYMATVDILKLKVGVDKIKNYMRISERESYNNRRNPKYLSKT